VARKRVRSARRQTAGTRYGDSPDRAFLRAAEYGDVTTLAAIWRARDGMAEVADGRGR
jgi:hypothetical protein